MWKITFCFTVCLPLFVWCNPQIVENYNNFKSDLIPIVINNNNYSEPYLKEINASISYLFLYNYTKDFAFKPPRVKVELLETDYDVIDPLIVVVRYRSGVMSWQLPYVEKSQQMSYNKAAHMLCPSINTLNNESQIVVSISTNSKANMTFILKLDIEENFNVVLDQEVSFNITPSEPVFYYYNFLQNSSMVLLHVKSEDSLCMTLSIQNATCPVFDSLETVQYDGLRQTVSKSGGIIISREEYPLGLFIVFVVHSDNSACIQGDYQVQRQHLRTKYVSFIIKTTVDFNYQILDCVVVVCLFILIFILTAWLYNGKSNSLKLQIPVLEEPTTSSYGASVDAQPDNVSYDSSLDETDVDILKSPESWKDLIRTKSCLYVSDLAKKDYRILKAKSRLYLWNLITVAVFYSLPVIQLVFTYQKVLNESGNQDLCYYNFLCSHSLKLGPWKFSDFNHIFSNIGYVFFGLLFMLITFKREYYNVQDKNCGIPNHCGLYYAMGSALAMEGIMSACYHVCPNHSNFQFDTSFMYIICMLSMIKIYQTRHPDINANAYIVYGVLAIVIILGLTGIMYEGPVLFILFTCLHLSMCLWLSAQIYYMGRWKLDRKTPKRVFNHLMTAPNPIIPKYPNRMVLLSIGILINLGLAVSHWFIPFGNFGNYLLTLFMVNLILYLSFYICMKLISKEKLLLWPMLFILLAIICWSASMYFYEHKSSSWTLSAAESRTYNTPCTFMDFYDNHDVWHFLSAASLFLSFMVLLTLDDDVANKPRSTIPVF
ncbi:SID1 transmembrane family member 1-like [Adelges cooleyi]|uniref:SID1 transmembrane family member 1-like n=1 Tax=Adelges cooleyi TaxID=133065 RepID=UPI00218085B7|nr:SID1 transmembrane family member 1-like [Adelges cooleyi]